MSKSKERVLEALANSKHRWQTARSIADETGISIAEVTRILERSPEIIRARKDSRHGEGLYARKEKEAAYNFVEDQDTSAAERHPPRFAYLVLLPFDASAKRMRNSIRSVVNEEQGDALFLDEIRSGAVWVDEVSRLIRTSDAVIADVSRLNPNVMFELGMAHGLGKPLVLLLSEAADINLPTDLLGYHFLTYSPDNLSAFLDRLRKTLRQLAQRRGAF